MTYRQARTATIALAMCMTAPVAWATGGELVFDVQPVTLEGRTLVPVRPIFEWLGATVVYDSGHLSAMRSEESVVPAVELWLGSASARVAGASYTLDVAPQLNSDRFFVPLRFVAESFGVWVEAHGRQMKLSVPQDDIEAFMAIPPHPESLLGKMWAVATAYYDLVEVNGLGSGHVEAHWGAREVVGIRVLDSRVLSSEGTGWMQVRVVYGDGEAATDTLAFMLEPSGWRIDNVQTQPDVIEPAPAADDDEEQTDTPE